MHTVLEQVSHNTKELGDLHHKLEDQHSTTLNDRENAANTRDHQLKCKKLYYIYLFIIIIG